MHRILGGKGTAPPGVPETPLVARHGAALATMALNMKQTEDPPSVSEILERSHQAQAEAVHNRLAFVKQLDMGMGIGHRNPELIRMLPDPATASATKKASGERVKQRFCPGQPDTPLMHAVRWWQDEQK